MSNPITIPAEAESDRRHLHERRLGTSPNSYAHQVLQFMVAFHQLPHGHKKDPRIPQADFDLASKLIEEEAKEFMTGFNKFEVSQSLENMTEMVDGAVDLVYVIVWAMNKFGIPFDRCFAEVQRSNMAKLLLDGTFEKNEFGKVKKPASWTPPDLFSILFQHFDQAAWQGNMRIGEKE